MRFRYRFRPLSVDVVAVAMGRESSTAGVIEFNLIRRSYPELHPNTPLTARKAVPDARRFRDVAQDRPAKLTGGARGQEGSALEEVWTTAGAATTRSAIN